MKPAGIMADLRDLLAHLPRALALIWAAAPTWTAAWTALLLLQGLLPIAVVALTKPLVDRIAALIAAGGDPSTLGPAVLPAVLMGLCLLVGGVAQGVMTLVRELQGELVRNHVSGLIHRQSVAVDYAFYESPDYYDQLHRARDEASERPIELLESLGGLAQSAVTMSGMLVILLPFGLWVPLALVLSVLPAFYVVFRTNQRYHAWWSETTTERRRTYYDEYMLTDGTTAAELRLFGLGPHFAARFQALQAALLAQRRSLLARQGVAQALSALAAAVAGFGAMAWVIWRAMQGAFSLGEVALFYQAFDRGQGLARTMLSGLGQIYASSLFLSNLFAFLDLRPTIVDPPEPVEPLTQLRTGLRFRDVTFRYPGSERIALRDFNLELPAGQLVAIVGANGAGKSTLVKLICRLYDPEAGAIELDEVDLKRFRVADLRRMITMLFQNHLAFQATAAENIAVGDLERDHGLADLEAAARGAGAHEVIERLPDGYATMLGKWFADGAELSGGEWQRVALARAFLRRSPILVLDEPTSAMDSWAEAEWLDRFRNLVAGRTALIITHRFTTAMRADIIHVMNQGQIIESGTHDQLLALNGHYAHSWRRQMYSQVTKVDISTPTESHLLYDSI